MKILMLTPYLPFPLISGGQTRSYNLIKNLSKKHEITLFSLIKDDRERDNIPELLKYCKKVSVFNRSKTPWTLRNILLTGFGWYPFLVIRNLSSEEKDAIKKELSQDKYDLIHAETFYVMPHIPKTSVPVLLVEQTIEYLVYNHFVEKQSPKILRPLLRLDVLKLKYWETHFWKQARKVVAMSDSDRREMEKLSPSLSIDIVPNGIDTNHFSKKGSVNNTSKKVLYVGNFNWLQNAEAVKILVKSIWPKIKKRVDDAKLWIVGKHMSDEIRNLASKDIEVSENVEDIRDAYNNASLLVAPIKGPGGTRLKILEAMASALPVVTTSVGAEGLGVKDNNEALIKDDLESLSLAAISVLKDSNLASSLGQKGREFVEKNYTWDKSSDKLDNIYKEVYGR